MQLGSEPIQCCRPTNRCAHVDMALDVFTWVERASQQHIMCAYGTCIRDDVAAGTDVKALLQKCLHSIIGSALPYKETGDAEEKALANTVTAGGLLLKYVTGKLQALYLLCLGLHYIAMLLHCALSHLHSAFCCSRGTCVKAASSKHNELTNLMRPALEGDYLRLQQQVSVMQCVGIIGVA